MKVNHTFLSINAKDFDAQSEWWIRLIGRRWDRAPMPSCHEWSLTEDILFQVLDSDAAFGKATVTLHVPDLDAERQRLSEAGLDLPEPVRIEGFETLRYLEFEDPEGNTVGLLDGS